MTAVFSSTSKPSRGCATAIQSAVVADTSTCLILKYHRIAQLCYDPLLMGVEPHIFEQQMEYLAQNFNVITLEKVKSHLETSTPFPPRTVAMTFDVGYTDLLYTAKDVLENFNLPVTVFATSCGLVRNCRLWYDRLEDCLLVGSSVEKIAIEIDGRPIILPLRSGYDRIRAYNSIYSLLQDKHHQIQDTVLKELEHETASEDYRGDDHRILDPQELRELNDSNLITIGAQTHNGVRLDCLNEPEQQYEIQKNNEVLEEVLGQEVQYFSYPFPDSTGPQQTCSEILRQTGYTLACGNTYDVVRSDGLEDIYQLPRVKVGNWNVYAFHEFLKQFFG